MKPSDNLAWTPFSRQAAHWVLAATAITAAEAAGSTVTAVQSWRRAEHHLAECVGAADGLRPVRVMSGT